MAQREYDVLVVGSGAAGGMAAKVLTGHGLEVVVLEAGPSIKNTDFLTHAMPYDFPFRGRGNPQVIRKDGLLAAREQTPFSGYYTKESEHPYTNAPTSGPDKPYKWTGRSRILGGRTLHWGRQSFRLAEFDFKAASIDGFGVDWPFTYADLAPYYDKVEDYVGIQGFKEGLPQIPDGRFLPPFAYNCFEHLIRKAAARKGWRMTALRTAQLSRYHRGRPPCHYCGSCGFGCDIGAFFSSIAVTLPDAAKTGKLTLLTDAVVREVVVDKEGRVRGVSYIDRKSKVERKVRAKVVVLAAGTLESTRILLNSVSRFHPQGMANGSGVLGHYLTDHFTAGQVIGVLPELVGSKIRNDDGKANGSYIPRYSNLGTRHPKFIRGYAIMVKGGSNVFPRHADLIGGFGAGYKKRIKELHPAVVRVYARGEALQIFDSYVEIDREVVDAWGIPVLKFHYKRTDNDYHMLDDAFQNLQELMHEAGAEILSEDKSLSAPGRIIHEMGTTRMGDDPRTSVLNQFCQAHEISNLFVMDGGCWPSSACQNPTETILAIAWRSSDYLAEQFRTGDL